MPTEAALVGASVNNGMSTELNIPFVQDFRNLRQAVKPFCSFHGTKSLCLYR